MFPTLNSSPANPNNFIHRRYYENHVVYLQWGKIFIYLPHIVCEKTAKIADVNFIFTVLCIFLMKHICLLGTEMGMLSGYDDSCLLKEQK